MTEEITQDQQSLPLLDPVDDNTHDPAEDHQQRVDDIIQDDIPAVLWSMGYNGDEDRDPVCTVEFASHSQLVDRKQRADRRHR